MYGTTTTAEKYIIGIAPKLSTIKSDGYLLIIINLGTLYRIPPRIASITDIYLFKNRPTDVAELDRARTLISEEGIEELRKIEREKIKDPGLISKAVYRDRTGSIGLINIEITESNYLKKYKRDVKPLSWGDIISFPA